MDAPFRFLKYTGKKALVLFLATVLTVFVAIDVTLTYLATKTDLFENTFTPPTLRLSIEGYDDVVNTGDVPVYVRAIAVANWLSHDDEHTILSVTPEVGEDYTIEFITDGWFYADDGFYYYKKVLEPGDSVALIEHAYQLKEKDGYEIRLEILSSAVQSYPTDAIAAAWPAVYVTDDGSLAKRVDAQ